MYVEKIELEHEIFQSVFDKDCLYNPQIKALTECVKIETRKLLFTLRCDEIVVSIDS